MISNPLAIIALVLGTILIVPMVCRKIRIPSIVGFKPDAIMGNVPRDGQTEGINPPVHTEL